MSIAIGCVAENTPKYLGQTLRLIQSIRWFGDTLNQADIYACVVGDIREDYRQELERYGATIRNVPRFSTKHPQSNKLRFLELPELANYEHILLLDCDTIVVRDPSPEIFRSDFSAKIADAPTVPLETFRRLFSAFALPMPESNYRCSVQHEPTIPYFNAGVLAFSHQAMNSLIPKWIELNKQLIDRMELLEGHQNFCEQASLALALTATDTTFAELDNTCNFPMHFEDPTMTPSLAGIDPFIIHYHWLSDPSGNILPSAYPLVNKRISEFNSRLRQEREAQFDNRLFWNQRYEENPELGSGLGSRGELRDYKRQLLDKAISRWKPHSILDVGCGDMEVGNTLPAEGYTGLDFSEVVVNANRKKYPNRNFIAGNFLDLDIQPADMVVCLDVLIHLASPSEYRRFVERLVQCAGKVGIVAGDETDPGLAGIVFFHEPLSHTLAKAGATNIRQIGNYRHVSMFEFTTSASGQQENVQFAKECVHPRDIHKDDLVDLLNRTQHPDLLKKVVAISRDYLGFFTSHLPRSLEYPWLLHQLSTMPPARMLEIGAGVSPVPLFLAEAGHNITTLDSHPLIRTQLNRNDWNEWGYLDYSQLHKNITSKHQPAETIFAWGRFDVVYSISVIEHMPAKIRRKIFHRASLWLKPQGRLLLTLDLVPRTNELWNRSEGKLVDQQGHGTLADIIEELSHNGFHIEALEYFRDIKDSNVDVVCIAAKLEGGFIAKFRRTFCTYLNIG